MSNKYQEVGQRFWYAHSALVEASREYYQAAGSREVAQSEKMAPFAIASAVMNYNVALSKLADAFKEYEVAQDALFKYFEKGPGAGEPI